MVPVEEQRWRAVRGLLCHAIFCLRKPGLYKLEVGLQNLHADDENGILALCRFGWERAETAVAGEVDGEKAIPFHIHDKEGSPGHPLFRYLRTTDGLPEQAPYSNPVCRKRRSCGTRGNAGQGKRQHREQIGEDY